MTDLVLKKGECSVETKIYQGNAVNILVNGKDRFRVTQIGPSDGKEMRAKDARTGVPVIGVPIYWWPGAYYQTLEVWPSAAQDFPIQIIGDVDANA